MAFKLGYTGALNYKVGGQAAAGSWLTISDAMDVSSGGETEEADVTTRGNNGYVATAAVLKNLNLEFEMIYDTANAAFGAIKDAWIAQTKIGFQILDAPGGEGFQADFMITRFTRDESLRDAMKVQVTAKPTHSDTAPSYVTP